MDRERVRQQEARCTAEQPAACAAACPLHVDGRALAEKAAAGEFDAACALFARAATFPRVLGRICDHPCEPRCKRAEVDAPVQLAALERACVEQASRFPVQRAQARRAQRVAVAGAGLSGLTAAVELGRKGYRVEVFERAARPGGRLLERSETELPAAALAADLEQLGQLGVRLRCGEAPAVEALLQEYDSLYLATGAGTAAPGAVDPLTLATPVARLFAGGSLRREGPGHSPVSSVADGQRAAVSIDRLLQGASLTAGREPPGPRETRLHASVEGAPPAPPVRPRDAKAGFTADEARAEAARCLRCRCLECVQVCPYLESFGAVPKRYVREIYNNDCIVLGQRKANLLVNSCSLCGLCAEVCPEHLDMAEVCRAARASMVQRGKMPPSAHEFALRDLAFSRSEAFTLARHAPGASASAAVFFPGCNLSASSPALVEAIYRHLRERVPGGVALHLGCCGAPADWAAREDLFGEACAEVAAAWATLGNPAVIAACPSCERVFAARLPAARVESLWTVLDRVGPPAAAQLEGKRLALHDPCAARHDRAVQDAVRRLLARSGAQVVELEGSRARTTCCSQGGLMSFANPALAHEVVARRIASSEHDFVSYCAMCRDNFAAQGKRAVHLLDLLCGTGADAAARPAATWTERRERRAGLKRSLLSSIWKVPVAPKPEQTALLLSPEVRGLLQRRMILEEEVRAVVAHAERDAGYLEVVATGHRVASRRCGNVTIWVDYSAADGGVRVHNAYSHRMTVQ